MTVLYTIGYEGTDISRFITTLQAAGVKRVADVRAVAVSRKKGFSKRKLAERLAENGIEYVHFVDLGDPKPGREAARAGRYEEFRDIYCNHLESPEAQESLGKLRAIVSEKATCLLCFERDPKTCHRSIVAAEVIEQEASIFDLYGDDPDRYIRNADRLPRFGARKSVTAA
ncbi:MAG: hypothetical protein COA37_17925 [Hoeflea sp.]|uniref:DUF488 domain-containing protein n=1 Tax=Hoeflea sp. TaxID=1940281 RepID=UPI000C0DE734|nr:DUF488 domain-containing protein [Hoeflea sp.]PHR19308.1 MAG: hypothetical protein COA37_17925 [Hoeflea sp.]